LTEHKPTLRFGARRIGLPGGRMARTILGVAFIIGGILWFLPVLGLWMLPVGVLILSIDFHLVRRLRRRYEVWWGRSSHRDSLDRWLNRVRRRLGRAEVGPRPTRKKGRV
jgi:membrane protein implicated in regulation of membrane protease activity